MQLIVDSGSTKSDWVLIGENSTTEYLTSGLNPNFHTEETVYKTILANKELSRLGAEINHVFFYGAGCSSNALNAIIEKGLKRVFTHATIFVDHDLKACAIATHQGEPSISCILGTGSNACFYDGNTVSQNRPSLGYLLGDEGSGAYFGKQLISSFLYKQLPSNIEKVLKEDHQLTKDMVFNSIYSQPNPNTYLASFMKVIYQFANDKYVKEMIFEGFKHFISIHVCCYTNYRDYNTHFVGSIAYLFQTELKQACEFFEVKIGQVIQRPISGLVQYHQQI